MNKSKFIIEENNRILSMLQCDDCSRLIKNSGTNKGCLKHRGKNE